MSSKYENLWGSISQELENAIAQAASGDNSEITISGLQDLGDRTTWYGKAEVHGSEVVRAPMAHLTSLARLVVSSGMCDQWPDKMFTFTVSSDGLCLKVTQDNSNKVGTNISRRLVHEQISTRLVPYTQRPLATRLSPSAACERMHDLLSSLPEYHSPEEVPFSNGLYFFYERGESSSHASEGRVVRIGNHPKVQDRLVTRLREHYRLGPNAKNGSVLRRYLGGALMRRTSPDNACLKPGPGLGHWEKQDEHTCVACSPAEDQVQEYLRDSMSFRCVKIDDLAERNWFESILIATLAACSECSSSSNWLGRYSYSEAVKNSGLWNVQHLEGQRTTELELRRFQELVDYTPAAPSAKPNSQLGQTLLIIPCSASKNTVADLGLRPISLPGLLGSEARKLLLTGRSEAFSRKGVAFYEQSVSLPAISYYTGQPYSTPGVRIALDAGIRRGLHCLIVSGGYGLLRAEEPIQRYNAYLGTQTRSIWNRRIPAILHDYVTRNKIMRSITVLSSAYAGVVPERLTKSDLRIVPTFDKSVEGGPAVRVVPEKVGLALAEQLSNL